LDYTASDHNIPNGRIALNRSEFAACSECSFSITLALCEDEMRIISLNGCEFFVAYDDGENFDVIASFPSRAEAVDFIDQYCAA
jgi:hypothetical protein